MLEEDYVFSCPSCGENMSVRIEVSAGQNQEFVYDCEVCCRPIDIRIKIESNEIISFRAEAAQ